MGGGFEGFGGSGPTLRRRPWWDVRRWVCIGSNGGGKGDR